MNKKRILLVGKFPGWESLAKGHPEWEIVTAGSSGEATAFLGQGIVQRRGQR